MASLDSVEPNLLGSDEPDFANIAHLGVINVDDGEGVGVIEDSVLVSALEIVASNVSLGDTNTAIPGRILGCLDIYEEANASQYVLDTISEVYNIGLRRMYI